MLNKLTSFSQFDAVTDYCVPIAQEQLCRVRRHRGGGLDGNLTLYGHIEKPGGSQWIGKSSMQSAIPKEPYSINKHWNITANKMMTHHLKATWMNSRDCPTGNGSKSEIERQMLT